MKIMNPMLSAIEEEKQASEIQKIASNSVMARE